MTNTQYEQIKTLLALISVDTKRLADACERAEVRFTKDVPADVRVDEDPNPTNDPRLSSSPIAPRGKRGRK